MRQIYQGGLVLDIIEPVLPDTQQAIRLVWLVRYYEQLAELAVIDRDKLSGARAERLRKLAASSDAVVRQAALRLLINHAELAKPHELLITALADEAPGCVAAAAEVLAQQPERAREPAHAAGRIQGRLRPAPVRRRRRDSLRRSFRPAILSTIELW